MQSLIIQELEGVYQNQNISGLGCRIGRATFGSPLEEGLGVIVRGEIKGEDKPRSWTVYMNQCETRNSPLWKLKPKQQLYYVCAKEFVRTHTPEVLLGVYTDDELKTSDTPMPQANDYPRVVNLPIKQSEPTKSEDHPFFAKLASCKSADDVEALRVDINMMRGEVRKQAIAEFTAKKESFTVPADAPKTFEQLMALLQTSDPVSVVEMSGHLKAHEQAALKVEANRIIDSSMVG